MTKRKRTECQACHTWDLEGSYHPHAYCLLATRIGPDAARAEINAVLNYGRKLERLKLPNSAPIGSVRE